MEASSSVPRPLRRRSSSSMLGVTDEDEDGVRDGRSHGKAPLDVNLKDDREATGDDPLDLARERAVAVVVDPGPLEELAVSHAAVELLLAHEVV